MRRFKDIYSATELSSLLGLFPDININIEYTNNDWCNLDDRLHNVLVSKGRMPNDELNEIGLLVESLIDSIP
ncbi:hypothetical protein ACWOA4_03685 [Pediococcus pentosaceus]|uniref:hypothetical protein n=1 Tax=Pediococcus pentosaceus TaxID=1255 RepID=UPI0018A14D21|nr:hypothetical protein [Pediococcus pentosaceus]MBF7106626.1 hypothetical protein [Pediococcus pentosaceus]